MPKQYESVRKQITEARHSEAILPKLVWRIFLVFRRYGSLTLLHLLFESAKILYRRLSGDRSAELQRAWEALDASERTQPEVVLHAAQRMLKLSDDAKAVMPWLTPLWNRMVQQPESCTPAIRERVAQTLARALLMLPTDAEWLASIDRARQTYPRWVELQYLAGMVCMRHRLWGKAQSLLTQSVKGLQSPALKRRAWCALAELAEQRQDALSAAQAWKKAALV